MKGLRSARQLFAAGGRLKDEMSLLPEGELHEWPWAKPTVVVLEKQPSPEGLSMSHIFRWTPGVELNQ